MGGFQRSKNRRNTGENCESVGIFAGNARISAHLGNDPLAVQDVQTTGHKYANSHPCHLVGEFVENEPPEEYGNGKFNVSERCKGNGRGFCVCPDVAEMSACSHHSNEREYPYVLRQRRFPDGGHDSGEDDSAGYCYDREGNECRSGVGEFAVENEIKRQACARCNGQERVPRKNFKPWSYDDTCTDESNDYGAPSMHPDFLAEHEGSNGRKHKRRTKHKRKRIRQWQKFDSVEKEERCGCET